MRIEQRRAAVPGEHPLAVDKFHRSIEAGTPARVTGCIMACHIYAKPHRVLVAIGPDFSDMLKIARRFAFLPKRVARTRPVVGDSGFQRQGERLRIHVRNHQKHAVAGIGDDRGDKATGVETRREVFAFLQLKLVAGRGREIAKRSSPDPGNLEPASGSDSAAGTHHGNEPDLLLGIVPESAGESGSQGCRSLFADAAHGHAHVFSLDHHRNATRI